MRPHSWRPEQPAPEPGNVGLRGRPGRSGAGGPGTPDSTGARSPETGAGSLPFRVPPALPPGVQRHRARNPVILSDHDLAVIQKAVEAARRGSKDNRQDAAAGQQGTGPGRGPPAEEPRETRPPEARCSGPPPAITQALPAANPAPPWGTVPANTIRLCAWHRFWSATTRWLVSSVLILVPGRAVGGAASVSEPAAVGGLDQSRTRRRRRLLLYVLAAASIVVSGALVDHWGVLPTVGANTSSSPAQVGGPPHRPQLLPPLGQPPVMHFSKAVNTTLTPAEPSAQSASLAAGPSGAQNPAARPTGPSAFAESP